MKIREFMETRRQRVDLNYLKAYYIHDNLRILISNRLKQVTGNRNIFFFYDVMIFIHCNKTRIKTSDQFEHVKTIGKLVSLTISISRGLRSKSIAGFVIQISIIDWSTKREYFVTDYYFESLESFSNLSKRFVWK